MPPDLSGSKPCQGGTPNGDAAPLFMVVQVVDGVEVDASASLFRFVGRALVRPIY